MSLNFRFIRNVLDNVKSLSDFDANLIKFAKINHLTYTQTVGDAYEILAKIFFMINKNDYNISKDEDIYFYKEIPDNIKKNLNLPEKDKGIDILFLNKFDKYTAVQCKFRSKDESILFWGGRDHLSHLIGSGTKCDSYAVFSNAYEVDMDVCNKMVEKQNSFKILNDELDNLDASFWENVRNIIDTKSIKEQEFKPYPDQQIAIDAVIKAKNEGKKRGKVIRFCGTGKSKVAKWIKDKINPDGITVLLVPSLSLAKQARKDWKGDVLFVCSDKTVDKNEDEFPMDSLSLGPNVTNDINEINNYTNRIPNGIIISTYQSSHLVKEALKGKKVSIIIFDESHRTACKEDSCYTNLLQDNNGFSADFRLFMTATPRIVSAQIKNRQKNEDLPYIHSMDNESIYGEELDNFSLRSAIDAKRVSPYKLVLTGITDEIIKSNIDLRKIVKNNNSYDMLANIYSLFESIKREKIHHIIVYHSSIDSSKKFVEIINQISTDFYIQHIDGTMSAEKRQNMFKNFKNAKIGILSNARCLTEGIDIKKVDAVMFCDPKSSKIDIVQAMGRSMRIDSENKNKIAHIIVPVYITKKEITEKEIESSNFSTLIYLIKALSEQDYKTQDFITKICLQKGKKNSSTQSIIDTLGVSVIAGTIDFIGDEFIKKVFFEEVSEKAKNHWEYGYQLACEYFLENGNCEFPCNTFLYSWGDWQKYCYKEKKLEKIKIEKLEKINFIWGKTEKFQEFQELQKQGYLTEKYIYDNIFTGIQKAYKKGEIIPDFKLKIWDTRLYKKETLNKFLIKKFGCNFKNRYEIKQMNLFPESDAGKKIGFTNLSRWRKSGKIECDFIGAGNGKNGLAYLYDINNLIKKLNDIGIVLEYDKNKFLTQSEVYDKYKICPMSQIKIKKHLKIIPAFKIINAGCVSDAYKIDDVLKIVDEFKENNGIIFGEEDNKKYICEFEIIKHISSIRLWRKSNIIIPIGKCNLGNNSSYYYNRKFFNKIFNIIKKENPKKLLKYLKENNFFKINGGGNEQIN
jgi:superfamily II DNA or RNA helicase